LAERSSKLGVNPHKTGDTGIKAVLPSQIYTTQQNRAIADSASTRTRVKKIRSQWVTLKVPATTCNIGPGLDTVALALNAYSTVTLELLPQENMAIPMVQLRGEIKTSSDHQSVGDLVYSIMRKVCLTRRPLLHRIKILIESDLPLNRGLGVSDSLILAALFAINAIEDCVLSQADLLHQCLALEAQPECVAASLLGDLVISAPAYQSNRVSVQQMHWPADWHLLCVVPSYSLATPLMRMAIPEQLPKKDVTHNLQHLALFLAAVANRNDQAMKEALDDRLHEAYRQSFVPALKSLRAHLKALPVIGCVLSGAGPSVLVICNKNHKELINTSILDWISKQGEPHKLLDLQCDRQGMVDLTSSYRQNLRA
jgi:homoserine kinase